MSSSIPTSMLHKFTTFGDLLRFLRRYAGLTQMELSIAVGYSDAQISRLEQNLRLPDIPTVEARFVPALGLDHESKVVSRLLELAANVRREDVPSPGLCPYKGLNYFDESDADLFVGREELTNLLTEHVLSISAANETRFLAVIGASGSGKSSLVRAGLVPALRWNKASADWHIHILTPTTHPLESLATSLTLENASVATTATLMDDFAQDTRSLHIFARRILQENRNARLLLVIDQFEELFSLCRTEEERVSFIGNLFGAASEADGPVNVVITLRADFYANCANYTHLRNALARNQEYIGAMNDEELRRAIEEPAQRGHWDLEEGLVERLLIDVGREPGALPLLSHALMETWQRRRGRKMTLSGYESTGGVRSAIAETAEAVFSDRFTSEQRSIARRIFLRLTELGNETTAAETRRRATFEELILKPEEENNTRDVLKSLADARLITTRENTVEVAHEALIREWHTLRGWLEENREGLRLQRQLTEAAQEWSEMDRSSDVLYRGARLAQAQEWALAHEDELNVLEREFLETSKEFAERKAAKKEAQRQRELEAARKLAESEKQRAEQQAIASEQLRNQKRIATSRELAAAAISNLEIDPDRSILLALSAVKEAISADLPVPREAEEALHRTVMASRLRIGLQSGHYVDFSPDGTLLAYSGPDSTAILLEFPSGRERLILSGHSDDLLGVSVRFSPDGNRLITTSADGTAKIWDISTGEELLTLRGHTATLFEGIFNPDGKFAATSSKDNTVRVWEVNSGEELFKIEIPDPGLISFDPEGKYLAVTSFRLISDSIEIWDVSSGLKVQTLPGHDQGTTGALFNSNGTQIISVGQDQKIKFWDLGSGSEVLTLGGNALIYTMALSPDGSRIATGGRNGIATVWDADSGDFLFSLPANTGILTSLSFSPDSKYLATGGTDQTTKIWDVSPAGTSEWMTLAEHTSVVESAEFSPDGRKIATASRDGTAIIWDGSDGRKLLTLDGFEGRLDGIAFNPNKPQFATADISGAVKVWDTDTGKLRLSIKSYETYDIHGANDIAFSPDGKTIGSGGSDGAAKLWQADSGQLIRSFEGHNDIIMCIAFGPDGSQIATASRDGTARIWQVSSGQPILTLAPKAGEVTNVDFHPEGRLLATAHEDNTAAIWNISTDIDHQEEDRLVYRLVGHSNKVFEATFSPDGRKLATCGFDGTVRLWDVETGEELLVLARNAPGPDMDFSPDGKFLLLAGADGTARVFLPSLTDLIELAKSRVTRSLTEEECQQYLHVDQCP